MAKGLQFSSLSVKELLEKTTKEISPVDLKKPYPGQLSAEKLKGIPIIREDQWITASSKQEDFTIKKGIEDI